MIVNKQTVKNKRKAGPGRPKGSVNRTTGLIKDAILDAAREVGNEKSNTKTAGLKQYMKYLAHKEPKAFSSLLGRVIPLQIGVDDKRPTHLTISFE